MDARPGRRPRDSPDVELEAVAARDGERREERGERVLGRAPPVAAVREPEGRHGVSRPHPIGELGRRARGGRWDRASGRRPPAGRTRAGRDSTADRAADPDVVEAAGLAVGVHARRLEPGRPRDGGLGAVRLGDTPTGSRRPASARTAGSSGSALKSPTTICASVGRRGVEPVDELPRLLVARGLVGRDVVEVGDRDERRVAPPGSATDARSADRLRPRSSRSTSRGARAARGRARVAVLRPAGPAAERLVAALARRADEAVLLERVDDLLEAEEVGLERGHVGEEQRQPLVPAVGEVADVERRDVERGPSPLSRAESRRRGRDRQGERERRPAALLGLDPDPAAVLLDDVAGDRQAEARAAAPDARPVDLVEPLEDPRLVGLRDADAVVLDRDDDARRPSDAGPRTVTSPPSRR